MTAVDELIRTARLMAETGATYRQVEHWTTLGYLRPVNAGKGSGFPWFWPAEEVAVVRRMVTLASHGVQVPAAAVMARDETELWRLYLAVGRLLRGAS